MGLARAANLPVILVGDIDRGGLLAHLFGTVAVLEPDDQALIAGFIVNKFRGDPALLEPGLQQLAELTGRPTYGVLPYCRRPLARRRGLRLGAGPPRPRHDRNRRAAPNGCGWRCRGCRGSPTPPTSKRWPASPACWCAGSADPADLVDADVDRVARHQVHRRRPGLAARARAGPGHRRTCRVGPAGAGNLRRFPDAVPAIDDPVESRSGRVEALGLLDADIVFAPDKVLRRWQARSPATRSTMGGWPAARRPRWFEVDGSPQGYRRGQVFGTHWHGLFDNDDFRRQWLTDAAAAAGRDGFVVPTTSMCRRGATLSWI